MRLGHHKRLSSLALIVGTLLAQCKSPCPILNRSMGRLPSFWIASGDSRHARSVVHGDIMGPELAAYNNRGGLTKVKRGCAGRPPSERGFAPFDRAAQVKCCPMVISAARSFRRRSLRCCLTRRWTRPTSLSFRMRRVQSFRPSRGRSIELRFLDRRCFPRHSRGRLRLVRAWSMSCFQG